MLEGVAKENASSGSWSKFVGGSGVEVREAKAAEDAKMVIARLDTREEEVWCVRCCFD